MFEITWTTVLMVLIICVLIHRILNHRNTSPNVPPSPKYRLPFIGHMAYLRSDMRGPLRKFRKQFGEIYMLKFANKSMYVLNGFPAIRDAFKHDAFKNRPHFDVFDKVQRGLGIVNTNGSLWVEHRRFTLSTLKDFGMGRSVLERKVHTEVEILIKEFESQTNPFDPKAMLATSISNIICSMVFGGNFQHGDPKLLRLLHLFDEHIRYAFLASLAEFFPLLALLPGDLFKVKLLQQSYDEVIDFIGSIVDDHIKEFDDNVIDDFSSAYIKEMKSQEQTDHNETTFSRAQLHAMINDLFSSGAESTATTLRWALVFMVNYPETQERMFTEISEHIGNTRLPSSKDKTKLVYVEAFYMETLRYSNLLIATVFRSPTEDFEFKCYTIPKGAMVCADLDSVFFDEATWGDPDTFRPERFVDDYGKLLKPEEYIPFSLGKRSCIGEALAKMELFIFIASIVQKFKITCPPGDDMSMKAIDGVFSAIHAPKPFRIVATLRQ